MDPFTPYSQNPSFLNLLQSQGDNPNPYESLSPRVELGSSEVPVFSTQCEDDPSVGVEERKERRKWTPKEDVMLISAWLNTSKDPVISNEQRAGSFWTRIQAYFNSSALLAGLQQREASHCKQRWGGRLNDQVCKFVGCYEAAMKEQSSGQNEDDVMKAAHAIFNSDHLTKFTLDHAWRELRHDQKWCSTLSVKDAGRSKRRKIEEPSAQSSSAHPVSHGEEVSMARPAGVKAAKAKGKKTGSNKNSVEEEAMSVKAFQSVWEIKKQDLAMKEKLAKHKLLDSLIAKSEPLDEEELALKKKLISDMLS
ncbi:Glutathione S-transferase T3 [Cardamine amara subsp. amara]|uniref:Glutathione S-transferase T3 n=1 Tax=Cardamine amara subsp. amara TaxID=228776 RepID=A0ABD1AUM1_CARAN